MMVCKELRVKLEAWRALAMWYLLRKSEKDSVFSAHLYQLR